MKVNKRHNKQVVFKIIALLLPFVFLLFIETILQLSNYGYEASVFIEDNKAKGYMYLNPDVTRKYFTFSDNASFGNKDYFKKKKDANTFRIFALGESSTAGYPYNHNVAFPRMLKYRLQRTYPNLNIEIINLGITAINSYAVLDFTKELVNYEPDAVVIYTGHNEYYGALGVASTNSIGRNTLFVNLMIKLKQFKLFQALGKLWEKVLLIKNPQITNKSENLMRRMAQQQIPLNDKVYKAGCIQFNSNLQRTLAILEKKQIPVFIGDLISNEKDQMPFISRLFSDEPNVDWEVHYKEALVQLKNTNYEKAAEQLNKAIEIDSSYAMAHYFLGQIAFREGNYDLAQKCFVNAKELDLLRFRAPEEFNSIIHSLAKNHNAVIVNLKEIFSQNSYEGVIGNNLILEHLHPNISGYRLIADSFYEAIFAAQIIPSSVANYISAEEIRNEYPYTVVDSLKGIYEIYMLKEGWPFFEKTPDSVTSKGSYEAQLAGGLAVKQINWKQANDLLFDHYKKTNNKIGMLKIMEGYALEYPFEANYYEEAAYLSDDFEKAIIYFKKSFQLSPSFDKAKNLFLTYLKHDKPAEAIDYLDYAISNNNTKLELVAFKKHVEEAALLLIHYNNDPTDLKIVQQIASNYIRMGNKDGALKYLAKAIHMDPDNEITLKLKNIADENI
jgi:tetratricopeptide (TPR) repeat protein